MQIRLNNCQAPLVIGDGNIDHVAQLKCISKENFKRYHLSQYEFYLKNKFSQLRGKPNDK